MASSDIGARYQRILQFFWDPEPRNANQSAPPIWCLGRKYPADSGRPAGDILSQPNEQAVEMPRAGKRTREVPKLKIQDRISTGNSNLDDAPAIESSWPKTFLDDFESRFWFSYRSQFVSIPKANDATAESALTIAVRFRSRFGDPSGFTTDTGWGCMIRSGQCLLGNALALRRLGRGQFVTAWAKSHLTSPGWLRGERPNDEKDLLKLFADDPKAPFSIHRFVAHGANACGKYPGEWFGPSATAQCIE